MENRTKSLLCLIENLVFLHQRQRKIWVLFIIGMGIFGGHSMVHAGFGWVKNRVLYSALETPRPIDYRITAFRCGVSKQAPRNPFILDKTLPSKIEVTYAMWLIEGGGRRILVDTGFSNQWAIDNWKITEYQSTKAALETVGLKLSDITDVFVSHAHWDHAGGLWQFSNAKLWMSKPVYRSIKKRGNYRSFFTRAKKAGRLNLTRRMTRIAPGVVSVYVGLHAPGSQILVVNAAGTRYVFSIDTAPLWANFKRNVSTGQTKDTASTLKVQSRILEWVDGDLTRVIPGHEPGIFKGKGHVVITGAQSKPGSR